MKRFVVDASVGAKWVLPSRYEPLTAEALQVLSDWRANAVALYVPDFFYTEAANILWKAVRLRRSTPGEAAESLHRLKSSGIPGLPTFDLLDRALAVAVQYDRTVYDCLYIALAEELSSEVLTADEKLANSLAGYLPVKWLGAL